METILQFDNDFMLSWCVTILVMSFETWPSQRLGYLLVILGNVCVQTFMRWDPEFKSCFDLNKL